MALVPLILAACRGPADPAWVDDIALNPDYLAMDVGQSDTLNAVPLDRSTRPLRERVDRVTFRVVDRLEPLGDGRAAITALQRGGTRVEARLGRGIGTALIEVQPPGLAGIRLEPNPVEMGFPSGSFRMVSATLLDAQGEPMSSEGFRFFWSVSDESVITINVASHDRVTLVAARIGTAAVTVTVGRFSETAPVVVIGSQE